MAHDRVPHGGTLMPAIPLDFNIHFRVVCKGCKAVIRQCSCEGVVKRERDSVCPECDKKERETNG